MSGTRKTAQSLVIGVSNFGNWWVKRSDSAPDTLVITLSGNVVEDIYLSGWMVKLLPSPPVSMSRILSAIDNATDSEHIKLLVIKVKNHDMGWGKCWEIFEAIKKFRAAGKKALCYLEEPENNDTLIASACDKAIMPPGTPLYLTGLISEVMYFKDVMEKLEIEPELFQAGKFKSAIEPYTRSGMSDEHRESVTALLDSIFERWVAALAAARDMTSEKVKELIDRGPWISEEAKEAGLIDDVMYDDQLDEYIEKWTGTEPTTTGVERFMKMYGPRPGAGDPWKKEHVLALITAAGPIHGGESKYYGPGDTTVGCDTLRNAIRNAREDDAIAAAVLRVDSPGGSAVHSDLIWREVEKLAEAKPVVVSMADVAASGGYYIAMPAHHIVASPTTITGSIGVIGGKINLQGLYNKIGINKERVTRGAHAEIATDYGALTDELREKIRNEMNTVYRTFVEKAARSRKQEYDELEKKAQGRVWTGEQALSAGLVDETGNLLTAIRRAKERAGIPVSRKIPVATMPRIKKFGLPVPFNLPGRSLKGMNRALSYAEIADYPLLALMPYLVKIL